MTDESAGGGTRADRNGQQTGDGKELTRSLSAPELVARVAQMLPSLTARELDELASAVENLTDAIAFTIETETSDELDSPEAVSEDAMRVPDEILRKGTRVVVKDYPSPDIPDALTRAGLAVTIYGGPTEADVVVSELIDGAIVHRNVGRYPDRADVLYAFRPFAEVDEIIAEAQRLGAHTIWRQPATRPTRAESVEWRRRVESAGLVYVDEPPIEEVASRLPR